MPLTRIGNSNVPKLIQAAPIGICITDEDGLYEMVNPAYCEFYGYAEEELLGRPFTLLMPEAKRDELLRQHRDFLQGEEEHAERQEVEVQHRSGEPRSLIVEASRMIDDEGRARKITFITDITERKAMERRLDFLARHDELTGLLNRRAGMARLEEEIARSRRHGTPLCVAICDLDHFKQINDRHGHATGDEALAAIAALIQDDLRRYDVLARLGGEEFLLVFPDATRQQALCSLERLRMRVGKARLTERRLSLTLSAGLASLEPDEASHRLMERADRALYRAKNEGRDRALGA